MTKHGSDIVKESKKGEPSIEDAVSQGGAPQEKKIHTNFHQHHLPSDIALRVKALETVLSEKKLIDPAVLDKVIDRYENQVGPHNGAKVVAKAWTDSNFKERLLKDATAAIGELDLLGRQGENMVVVENQGHIHNLVVCTLCSCYPWPVLGLPPSWYKSSAYRARAVSEPRAVLKEFGLQVPNETEIRVWDSTAETRYLVLPRRPEGKDTLSEEELADLVTRDSMIGVAVL
jgi:nitrile hydratase